MHHGYYSFGHPEPKSIEDHKVAQATMIDKALDWASAPNINDWKPESVVDVGCGIGGSARHIARRFGIKRGSGITLVRTNSWPNYGHL
jgi:tocopherol O-methyltransferase